jgi:hypothetical protein
MRHVIALCLLSITACGRPVTSASGDKPAPSNLPAGPASSATDEVKPVGASTAAATASAAPSAAKDDPPFDPDGVVVRIPGLGLTFTMPHARAGELYEGARLAKLRGCGGEWDKEFAEVVDAALPFDDLIAHVGSEPMCKGAVFDDIHVRAYVVPRPIAEVTTKIKRDTGPKTAAFAAEKPKGRRLGGEETDPKWKPRKSYPGYAHIGIAYSRFYGDYGGTAHVDFFAKAFGDKTLVMVIMSTRSPVEEVDGKRIDPFEQIMTSVKPETAGAKK